jgi:ComEC/Rec2-related protein
MKNPLFVVGFSFAVGILLCSILSPVLILVAGVLCLCGGICAMIFLKELRKTIVAIALSVCVGFVFFSGYTQLFYSPVANAAPTRAENSEGLKTKISGRVSELGTTSGGKYYYILDAKAPVNGNIIFYSDISFLIDVYDQIEFDGAVFRGDESLFSSRRSDGVYLYATNPDINLPVITEYNGSNPIAFISRLRYTMLAEIDKYTDGRTQALVKGISLGDTSDFTYSDNRTLQTAGIYHVVSVSGFHLSLLVGIIIAIGTAMHLSKKIIYPFCLAFVVAFVILVSPSPSLIRAAILTVMTVFGHLLRRESSPLNSLGAALIVVLATNPYAVFGGNLLLSFSATFGIAAFSPKIRQWLFDKLKVKRKIPRAVISSLSVSTAVTICSAPFVVAMFSEFPLYFALGNLLTEFFTEAILVVGFFIPLFSGIPIVAQFAAFVCKLFAEATFFICEAIAMLPFARLPLGAAFVLPLTVISIIILGFAIYIKKNIKIAAVIITSVFLISAIGNMLVPKSTEINIFGSAVLVQTADMSVVLNCGDYEYSARQIANTLLRSGVRKIDALVLLNADDMGAVFICENLDVGIIYMPYGKYYSKIQKIAESRGIPLFDDHTSETFTVTKNNTLLERIDLPDQSVVKIKYGNDVLLYGQSSFALKRVSENEKVTAAVLDSYRIDNTINKINTEKTILVRRPEKEEALLASPSRFLLSYEKPSAKILLK